jgi:hypothetical protein
MKKIVLVIIVAVSMLNVEAQVLYTANDFGNVGEVYQKKGERIPDGSQIAVNDIDPQMWNISSLISINDVAVEIFSSSSFDELDGLVEDCMLIETMTGSYQILKVVDNTLVQYGIYAYVNDQYTPLIFDNPMELLSFPISIGETKSSDFTFETSGIPKDFGVNESMLDSMRFETHIVMSSEVIGEGELITAEGFYEAMKIYNTFQMTIDVWVKPPMNSWTLYQQSMVHEEKKELQYFAADYGIPVAEIRMNWDGEVTGYNYMLNTSNGIESGNMAAFKCYPNPVKSGSYLYFDDEIEGVLIFDLAGRKVFESVVNSSSLMLPELNPGNYIVRTSDSDQYISLIVL